MFVFDNVAGQDARESGWPGPYIYTVYDHRFGDFPAKNHVYIWLWPTLHASNVCTPSQEKACKRVCIFVKLARVVFDNAAGQDADNAGQDVAGQDVAGQCCRS